MPFTFQNNRWQGVRAATNPGTVVPSDAVNPTQINLNIKIFDVFNAWQPDGSITVPVGFRYYSYQGAVVFPANAAGSRFAQIRFDNASSSATTLVNGQNVTALAGFTDFSIAIPETINENTSAGVNLKLVVCQNSGGPLTVSANMVVKFWR